MFGSYVSMACLGFFVYVAARAGLCEGMARLETRQTFQGTKKQDSSLLSRMTRVRTHYMQERLVV